MSVRSLMAVAIMISTFGCNNGLILAGPRAYYAMAKDGLFFQVVGRAEQVSRACVGLVIQGIWSAFYVLPRTVTQRRRQTLRQSLRRPADLRHLGRADLLHSDDRRRFLCSA